MHDPKDNEPTDEIDVADDTDAFEDDEELDDDYEDEDEDDEQPADGAGSNGAVDELVDLVRFMVSALVDEPETLEIRPEQFGQNIHIKIIVPEEDMGRVIGRQGRIARSMRTLLTIAASRKGLRASLDIDS